MITTKPSNATALVGLNQIAGWRMRRRNQATLALPPLHFLFVVQSCVSFGDSFKPCLVQIVGNQHILLGIYFGRLPPDQRDAFWGLVQCNVAGDLVRVSAFSISRSVFTEKRELVCIILVLWLKQDGWMAGLSLFVQVAESSRVVYIMCHCSLCTLFGTTGIHL